MLGKSNFFRGLISKNVSVEGHTCRDCSVERVNVSMIVSPHVADWGLGGGMKFYSCLADGESCDKTAFRRMFPSPSLPLSTTQLRYLTSNQIFRGYAPFLLNLLQHKRARFLKKSVVAGSGRQDFLCQLPLWDDRHVRGQQPHHQIHHHHHIQIQPISILIRTA